MANTYYRFVSLEVQTAGAVMITVFWKVLPTRLHGVTSQKAVTFI
jgi:hypothetical protein